MTQPQLPPTRRRPVPQLPDPMAPTPPSTIPATQTDPADSRLEPQPTPASPQPALGISSTMPVSVRTSPKVRAMFDALAADDAQRNSARVNNRFTLDRIIADAYRDRFGPRW